LGVIDMKNRIYKTVILFLILSSFKYSSAGDKIALTALNSMERIGQNQKIDGAHTVKIWSARNEVESFQVVVSAPKENINVIKVEISDLIGPKGSKIEKEKIKLFREEYVRVRMSTPRAELPPGLYPDPLVPFINPITGKPIEPLNRTSKRWGNRLQPAAMICMLCRLRSSKGKTRLYGLTYMSLRIFPLVYIVDSYVFWQEEGFPNKSL